MYKRKEYSSEEEARIVFFNGQNKPARNRIAFIIKLIVSIVIAPYANEEFSQHIKEVVKEKSGNIQINESRLEDPSPLYDTDLERKIPTIGRNAATGAYSYLSCGTFRKK